MSPKAAQPTLSENDLTALFGGTYKAPEPAEAPKEVGRPWKALYERCDHCKGIQPCLMSFSGSTDWDPYVAIDGPCRKWVSAYRRENFVRTVNLCSTCVETLDAAPPVTYDGQLELFTS